MYHLIGTGIEADREKRVVRKDGREIRLTGLEFGLLDYLSSHANHICTRDKLLERVWGERFRYDTGTIDVHLNALRRKLGFSKSAPIETIRGASYTRTADRITITGADIDILMGTRASGYSITALEGYLTADSLVIRNDYTSTRGTYPDCTYTGKIIQIKK